MHQGAFGAFFLHVAFFTTPMMYLSDHASSDRTLTEEFSLCAMCRSCISAVKLSMQGTAFRHLDIIFSKGRNAKLLKRAFSTVFATAAEGTSGFSSGLGASRINRPKSLKRSRISTQLSHWALRPFSSLKTTVFPAAAICQKLQLQNAKAAKQQLQTKSCKPTRCKTNTQHVMRQNCCQTRTMSNTVLSHVKHVRRTAAKHSRGSSEPAPLKPKTLFQEHSCSKTNSRTTFLKCGNSNTSARKEKKNKLFQHSCSYALDGI